MNRKEHFQKVIEECKALFVEKNKAYGDDFFEGEYSDLERWMSIKRKIARLTSKFEKGNDGMPSETVKDTWMDLANYCIMEIMLEEIKSGKQ